jgi:hypothetical protein
MEVVWNHAHLFLGVEPTDAPRTVALAVMNNSAYFLEQRYGSALADVKLEGVW